MTESEALEKIGRGLWGSHWITPMSEALGVQSRTLRYWVSGRNVPENVWAELSALCRDRIPELVAAQQLADSLKPNK